jgi:hypothetical protein
MKTILSFTMPYLWIRDMGKLDAYKRGQRNRSIETVRELGCDDEEAAFDEKLRRIATARQAAWRMRNPHLLCEPVMSVSCSAWHFRRKWCGAR